jgi:hypothetical protein
MGYLSAESLHSIPTAPLIHTNIDIKRIALHIKNITRIESNTAHLLGPIPNHIVGK